MFENKQNVKKKKEKDTMEEKQENKDTNSQEKARKSAEKTEFKHPRVKTSSLVTPYKKNSAKVAKSPKRSSTRPIPISKFNSPSLKTKSNKKQHLKGGKLKQKQATNVNDIRRYFENFTAENTPEDKPPDKPNCRAALEAETPNQSGPKFTVPETSRISQRGIKGKYMGNLATSLSSTHATDNSETGLGDTKITRTRRPAQPR